MKNSGSAMAGSVVLFFVLLFAYTKLAGPIPFTVNNINTVKDAPFQVEGQGNASAAPDQTTISFGVTKSSSSVSDAQTQTNSTIKSILENLKDLSISDKDIRTTNYSVNPNYDFNAGRRITGYTVTQNIEMKIKKIENTNKAIDSITAGGANLVGQIRFGFSDKSKALLEEKARKEAVDNAKQRAQSIAKVTGVRLGKIINVSENEADDPRFFPLSAGRDVGGAPEEETEIPVGESSIKTNITLTYEIL